MHPALVDLPRELLAAHLVPEERALLVHLFELAIPDDSIEVFLPVGLRGSKYLKCVMDHCFLDLIVQGTVRLKRGCLVDLEEPRLRIGVDEDVEAEHLVAHVERAIVRLARPVIVKQIRLHRNQSLDDQVGDFQLEQIDIDALLSKSLIDCIQCSFGAGTCFDVLISNLEILSILVNRVVRQVRLIGHLSLALLDGVWLGREPSNALLVPEDCQWMAGGDKDVEPQIEFQSIEQVRVWNVPLHDIVDRLVILGSILRIQLQCVAQLLHIVYEKDSFALTGIAWFDDHDGVRPCLRLVFDHITLEFLHLVRDDPRLRIKAEIDRVLILHLLETLC